MDGPQVKFGVATLSGSRDFSETEEERKKHLAFWYKIL